MELKQLTEETLKIFEAKDTLELIEKLRRITLENDYKYYDKFIQLVGNLDEDYLQKIFQYYEADRKDKKQDYTPKCLAKFISRLSSDSNEDEVLDLCAGSGALTIQKWNMNKKLKFICKEFDEKVIPILIFNLAIRNIESKVIQCDVLQNEIYHEYKIYETEKYGKVEVIK